jgi:hypothetical protein
MDGSFFELKLTFDDDEKVDVGIEGNNSRARCGSENERVRAESVGDFHSPKPEGSSATVEGEAGGRALLFLNGG